MIQKFRLIISCNVEDEQPLFPCAFRFVFEVNIESTNFICNILSGSRALKFHREDNLVYPWPHAEFQINPMAPAALWGTDIRLIPIFIPFPENGSHFGSSWNF